MIDEREALALAEALGDIRVARARMADWWKSDEDHALLIRVLRGECVPWAEELLASDWLAQVKATARAEGAREALGQAAEELGDPRTLPNEPDKPLFAVMAWLRDRARSLKDGAQ